MIHLKVAFKSWKSEYILMLGFLLDCIDCFLNLSCPKYQDQSIFIRNSGKNLVYVKVSIFTHHLYRVRVKLAIPEWNGKNFLVVNNFKR